MQHEAVPAMTSYNGFDQIDELRECLVLSPHVRYQTWHDDPVECRHSWFRQYKRTIATVEEPYK